MIYSYLVWWYGQGLVQVFHACNAFIFQLTQFFSLTKLVRTWFAPWKDDVLDAPSDGIISGFKNNLISRLVGFFIRTFTIFFGLVALLILIAFLAGLILIWLVIPLSVVVLPAISLVVGVND